jgi:hypothetical protein
MGARIVQLRNAFGLDDSEELYGQFSCAHTRPRWGAQFLQVGTTALETLATAPAWRWFGKLCWVLLRAVGHALHGGNCALL